MGSYMDFKSFGEGGQSDVNVGRSQGNNFPLARQSSIYSLTFDELQTSFSGFGKDFGSMNMDELLKNIWTAEETTQGPSESSGVGCRDAIAGVGGLQKQGSLTLPRTVSQKTVDQVWRDLYKEESRGLDSGHVEVNFQPRQRTLGEMTLEDFLLKAGVVMEDVQCTTSLNNNAFYGATTNANSSCINIGFQQPGSGLKSETNPQNGMTSSRPSQQQLQAKIPNLHPLFPKPANVTFSSPMHPTSKPQLPNIAPKSIMIGMADTTINNNCFRNQNNGMGMVSLRNGTVKVPIEPLTKNTPLDVGDRNSSESSPLAPSPYVYSPVIRGRRGNTGVEKVVERRHRRMIKNRESAARSRARKQAYTLELEAEIAKLREMNEDLHQKQEEIMEIQKDEMIEKMRLQWGGKRVCLRRTLTGPW